MSTPQILVVDDELEIRSLLKEILTDEGYDVAVAADAQEARDSRTQKDPDLVLLDIWMPDTDGISLLREWSRQEGMACPVVMMSGHGTVDTAVEATRLGAFDYIEKPISLANLLRTVERALKEGRDKLKPAVRQLVPPLAAPVGKSQVMKVLRDQVRKLASYETPVLVTGEPGTGREAFARYIHSLSPRAAGPFVPLVAGSLTRENAESQVLGNERDDEIQVGYLEQAAGGVLFINELGDLSQHAQKVLLSALEQNGFMRASGKDRIRLDIRIISSAAPGFQQLAGHGAFRQDLLAHLNVVPLRIPPLREYAEDVPDLLRYYVDKLVDNENLPFRRFSVAAQNRLRNYPWPGNVRELKNIVQRLLVLDAADEVSLEEIEAALAVESSEDAPLVKQDLLALPLREAREQFEKAYLTQQLMLCGGKVGALAKRVGMERTHLYRKLKQLGVEFGHSGDES